jgi:hypothetical protein
MVMVMVELRQMCLSLRCKLAIFSRIEAVELVKISYQGGKCYKKETKNQ